MCLAVGKMLYYEREIFEGVEREIDTPLTYFKYSIDRKGSRLSQVMISTMIRK